jgi:putative heme-binding domain-containing protein
MRLLQRLVAGLARVQFEEAIRSVATPATCILAILCFAVFCSDAVANNNHNHTHHATSRYANSLPAWRLTDANQNVVSSDQFAGKPYVLVLHLGQGCLHCAEQLHAFGEHVDGFHEVGIEVVGVSTDSSDQMAQQLEAFGKSFPIRYLASDESLNLFREVGAFDKASSKPLHATLLVDAVGRVRWSNIGTHPFMEIEKLLDEARFVSVGATTTQEDEKPNRPKIFLDKPERMVLWQLGRLNDEQLLMVTRKTDDKKYAPVWATILGRESIESQYRKEALKALTTLNGSSAAHELIKVLNKSKASNREEKRSARDLAKMLLRQDQASLAAVADQLVNATESKNEILASTGFAGLVAAGQKDKAVELGNADQRKSKIWLKSIGMIRDRDARNGLRDIVVEKVGSDDVGISNEALRTMRHFMVNQKETWAMIAGKIKSEESQDAAIATLLDLPKESRDPKLSKGIIELLIRRVESTPAKNRTGKESLLAVELADELIADLEEEDSAAMRGRLSAVAVRVVRIKTVKEEMRYDVPYFAVEAGRPIQIVLDNVDLMPHNLIVCKPGKLKQVANDGLAAGLLNGLDGKQYVPRTKDVLHATDMVQSNRKERLTFTAPKKTGAYPYVCTFPQHWSRMYGVMVVVEDLAAWEKNPIKPEDPIGNTRQLVKKWTVADFEDDIKKDLAEHSVESGKRIFTEATCAQCHKLGEFGGAGANVGPALDDLYSRWKNDRGEALKQILDPSSHVDPKYKMFIVATDDGLMRSGIIVKKDDDSIEMLESGSVSKTTIIPKDEIDEMAESKKSIMPKALLDNFTKEEILDLMKYLESNQK